MSTSKGHIRIELTPEQKAMIRKVIGKDAETLELSIEELEERIAPMGDISIPYKKMTWE